MRVICDAPGQTCNRLWTYVASVAQCIAEHKRMVIIFYDWTIEDFPALLKCPFIYFPLWHKWYLERGNGWNNYKGLTWKGHPQRKVGQSLQVLWFHQGLADPYRHALPETDDARIEAHFSPERRNHAKSRGNGCRTATGV